MTERERPISRAIDLQESEVYRSERASDFTLTREFLPFAPSVARSLAPSQCAGFQVRGASEREAGQEPLAADHRPVSLA